MNKTYNTFSVFMYFLCAFLIIFILYISFSDPLFLFYSVSGVSEIIGTCIFLIISAFVSALLFNNKLKKAITVAIIPFILYMVVMILFAHGSEDRGYAVFLIPAGIVWFFVLMFISSIAKLISNKIVKNYP